MKVRLVKQGEAVAQQTGVLFLVEGDGLDARIAIPWRHRYEVQYCTLGLLWYSHCNRKVYYVYGYVRAAPPPAFLLAAST